MQIKNAVPFLKFRYRKWKFLSVGLGKTVNANCDFGRVDEDTLVITVVAFNNVELLRYQCALINYNLKDAHLYVVLDNSSDPKYQDEILKFCKESGLPYVRCPGNPFTGQPSWSHALALEWFVLTFVKPKKARFFGFIDHDIFPFRQTSILAILRNQPVYGSLVRPKQDSEVWYLWAGFCFFDFKKIPSQRFDFMPGNHRKTGFLVTDSGGSNWKDIYSKLDRKALIFSERKRVRFRTVEDRGQSDYLDYHEDWVHTLNGSYWMAIKDREGKDSYVRNLLEELIAEAKKREGA